MAQIIVITHTGDTENSGTDDVVNLELVHKNGSMARSLTQANYNDRVRNRTDLYNEDVGLLSATDITSIKLKLSGKDGWRCRDVWVLWTDGADSQLLVARPGIDLVLDNSSRSQELLGSDTSYEAGLWLIHRTSNRSNADTNEHFILHITTLTKHVNYPLPNLPHDERNRLHTDTYVITNSEVQNQISSILSGNVWLEIAGRDGWLPQEVILIGRSSSWHNKRVKNGTGNYRLLGLTPDWSKVSEEWANHQWFDRSHCPAHSIDWLGQRRLWAGPMVANVTSDSADIWIWLNGDANTSIEMSDGSGTVSSEMLHIYKGTYFKVHHITGLQPDTDYHVMVRVGNMNYVECRFHTAAIEHNALSSVTNLDLQYGSCIDTARRGKAPVLDAMGEIKSDLTILCGDTCYYLNSEGSTSWISKTSGDMANEGTMFCRQLEARSRPELQRVLRTRGLAATWDDHDYAWNNVTGGDGSGKEIQELTTRVFRSMWPGGYKNDRGSIEYEFIRDGIQFIVPDGRSFRKKSAPELWGNEQTNWIQNLIRNSTSPLIVLCVGTQFLHGHGSDASHKEQAPNERSVVLQEIKIWLAGNKSRKFLILSGDIHRSELMVESASDKQSTRLLELTSSPIRINGEFNDANHNDFLYWGGSVRKESFAQLHIDLNRAVGMVTINGQLIAEDGVAIRAFHWLGDGTVVDT